MDNWLEFTDSVERSIESTQAYIQGKMSLLTLSQEHEITRRLNWISVFFATFSGIIAIIDVVTFISPSFSGIFASLGPNINPYDVNPLFGLVKESVYIFAILGILLAGVTIIAPIVIYRKFYMKRTKTKDTQISSRSFN